MIVTQSRLHKSDLLDQFWTDIPVVPESFHPYFHRSKRAKGKQRILIENCLIQQRLTLQKKFTRENRNDNKALTIEKGIGVLFYFSADIFT